MDCIKYDKNKKDKKAKRYTLEPIAKLEPVFKTERMIKNGK